MSKALIITVALLFCAVAAAGIMSCSKAPAQSGQNEDTGGKSPVMEPDCGGDPPVSTGSDDAADAGQAPDAEPYAGDLDFHALYIRTDGYDKEAVYPRAVTVGSTEELRQYIDEKKGTYSMNGFENETGIYGDGFFRDSFLIIVLLEEGSGSISHSVTGVRAVRPDTENNDLPSGTDHDTYLCVEITRDIPEACTDDMAEHHIVIEVPRSYGYGPETRVDVSITSSYAVYSATATDGFSRVGVSVPRGEWKFSACDYDRENGDMLFSLTLSRGSRDDGKIEIICTDVAGDVTADPAGAGTPVRVGMFDGTVTSWGDEETGKWNEILLADTGAVSCRIVNTSSSEWWKEYGEEADEILRSLWFSTDFTFSIRWGVYGISSYDMAEAKLVKTSHATNPEDYITKYVPDRDALRQIIRLLRELDIDSYPSDYDPLSGVMSTPFDTLEISVNGKTVRAAEVAIMATSEEPQAERFLRTIREISGILMSTDEWKSLPDYEFLYD